MNQTVDQIPHQKIETTQRQSPPALPHNEFGPVYIRDNPKPVEVSAVRCFQFAFYFEEDHDLFQFEFSGELDLTEDISEWLMDYNLDLHFLKPIRKFVKCTLAGMFETSRHRISINRAGATPAYYIPPARFRKREQQALSVPDTQFSFIFVLGDDDGYLELRCSNRDEIAGLVKDWLDDHELKRDFLTPVRDLVEHLIEGLTENPRHDVTMVPRHYLENRPSCTQPLPSRHETRPTWRSEHTSENGNLFALDLFCSSKPAHSTSAMRRISPTGSSDFNNHHFWQCVLDAIFPEFLKSVPSRVVSVTMAICAQILHHQAEECPCCNGDFEFLEEFQLTILKRLIENIPNIGASPPLHDRLCYLFEQLQSFLQTSGQRVD